MSCYTRHLGDWLPPDPTWPDRRALDAAVRAELGLTDAECPEVWTAVKQRLAAGDTVLRGTPPASGGSG